MKLNLSQSKLLLSLMNGESIPASRGNGAVIQDLINEKILIRKGKIKGVLVLASEKSLKLYLINKFQVSNLELFIEGLQSSNSSRSDFTSLAGDSKLSKERAFKGFLVNSYDCIHPKLNGHDFPVLPPKGSFVFISDYETFKIPKDVVVVGVENSLNFRNIQSQKYLFGELKVLFISRYPQSQHNDLIRWIKGIPNQYLHYGDLDLAGIGIYINEYKKYLGDKCTFYVPENFEDLMKLHGNSQRYNVQKQNFSLEGNEEKSLITLLKTIHILRKGLDQEIFIKM